MSDPLACWPISTVKSIWIVHLQRLKVLIFKRWNEIIKSQQNTHIALGQEMAHSLQVQRFTNRNYCLLTDEEFHSPTERGVISIRDKPNFKSCDDWQVFRNYTRITRTDALSELVCVKIRDVHNNNHVFDGVGNTQSRIPKDDNPLSWKGCHNCSLIFTRIPALIHVP